MKRKIVAILVVFVLCLGLGSCKAIKKLGKPKSAEQLWDRISESMGTLNSYKVNLNGELKFSIDDLEITGDIYGEIIIVDAQSENLYYYQSTKNDLSSESMGVFQSASEMIAYENGVIYLHEEEDKETNNLCADISLEDFINFHNSESFSFAPEKSGNSSFVNNDDKSWTLKCSDFEEDYIREFSSAVGISSIVTGYGINVSDVVFEISAFDGYYLDTMKISIIDEDNSEFCSITYKYSSFDSASKKSFEKDNYNKVDDVIIVNRVTGELFDALSYDSGKFVLSVKHTVTKGIVSSKIINETDTVSYKVEDGKLSFDIAVTDGGSKYQIEYVDGQLKTSQVGGTSVTKSMTEEEARTYLVSLVNHFGYSSIYVKDVERLSDSKYKLICEVKNTSSYKQIVEAYGDKYKGYDLCFIVELNEEGKIEKVESQLTAYGSVLKYEVINSVDISD